MTVPMCPKLFDRAPQAEVLAIGGKRSESQASPGNKLYVRPPREGLDFGSHGLVIPKSPLGFHHNVSSNQHQKMAILTNFIAPTCAASN